MKLAKICVIGIIVVWLPLSIPLIFLGVMARMSVASVMLGYEITDDFLRYLYKRGLK